MNKKTALITGGIGGIGTAVCKALNLQGRRVVAGHLPSETDSALAWQAQLLADEHHVDIVAGDVACFDASATMIAEIENRIGTVDILVNCAGITRDSSLKKMELDQWNQVISTNLSSVFNVTRQIVEGMTVSGFGRIVNICSINGQKGQFGQTNYAAAKAGMHGFTMSLAQEVARKGVTVNSVSPGYIDTPMTRAMPDEIRQQIIDTIPVGRVGLPEDIAHVIAFLCADETDYITGANIPVNGGMLMTH